MSDAPSPRSKQFNQALIGAPIVPPGWVTGVVLKLRAMLGRLHQRMAPPAVRIMEGLFGLLDNRALAMLVEYDVPDRLSHPMGLQELATLTDTSAPQLRRLLNYAVARGFVDHDGREHYAPNPVTEALRRDVLGSWRGWVEFMGARWFHSIWQHLDLRPNARPATERALGSDFFHHINQVDREAGRAFDSAMACGGQLQGLALAHALPWGDVRSVCDVGGGSGATLEVLLGFHLHLEGELYDLPQVIKDSKLSAGPLAARCRTTGGDFFEAIPKGHDRYLALAVIHDWDDARALKILRQIREAMPRSGRLFRVENVLGERSDGFTEASDLMMLALASGRERTRGEFSALFQQAEPRLIQEHALASGTTAFELSSS